MTRFLTRLFRKAARAGAIAFAAATFTAPVFAEEPPKVIVRGSETNRLLANGDAKSRCEFVLPAKGYEAIKKSVPDATVLLRKLGLSNQESVVAGVKGEWVDDTSTIRIEFTTHGAARLGKDGRWGVPIPEGMGTKLVGVEGNEVRLSQSMEIPGGMGVAVSTIRLTLPAGASDVAMSRDKSRLTYKLPEPTAAGRTARATFDVDAKTHVMASLAKVLSHRKFANLWVTRSVFRNTGDQLLRDYRVRFRMTDYTSAWSPWAGTPLVVPGQTVVDAYHPVMDVEKLAKMTGQARASVEVQYRYTRADGTTVEDTETKELTLLARNQVQYSSMKFEECTDWADAFDMSAIVMGTFVTHEDPVIQQAAGRICKAIGGPNAAGSDEDAIKFMAAAYDFMGANIAYQTPPGNIADQKLMQHVKYGRDVLKNKAGTCIDLAILYGSLCEAVGLKPVLFNIPGHCFPGVYLPKSGKLVALEATLIGKASFLDAVKHAATENLKPIQDGKTPTVPANIEQLHSMGVHPLDLPALADDVLDKWGITFDVTAAETKPEPKDEPKNAAPVGLWRTTYRVGHLFVVQTTGIDANGDIAAKAEFGNGFVHVRKGTYKMREGKLIVTLTDGSSHKGKVVWNGKDEFTFDDDDGPSLVYKRVK